MATYNVSTTAELTAALSLVKDGDTILMASGEYSGVAIKNINIDGNVTITSADAANPAVLLDLTMKSSSGITLSNLEFFEQDAGTYWNFNITGCSNVALDNVTLHGPDNIGSGEESHLLLIRGSSDVSVTNCEFYDLYTALNILDCNGVTVSNNSFHDIRMDGIRCGGTSNITITSNYFTDFYPATGDHGDCIQFWTTNTTSAAYNITITDNLYVRGEGASVQGIFMRDEVGSLPYQNVTVTDNVMLGTLYHAITPSGVESGLVSDNIVIGYIDQRAWIYMTAASSAMSFTDNISTYYNTDANTKSWVAGGDNLTVTVNSNVLGSYLFDWAAQQDLTANELSDLVNAALYASFASTTSVTSASGYSSVVGTSSAETLKAVTNGYTYVIGVAGSDKLYDNTAGHNYLLGGEGDDTYYLYSTTSQIIEASGSGTDHVYAYVNYTMADNLERLTLAAGNLTAYGNELANSIAGSSSADIIYGMAGDDAVNASSGDDLIYGGDGNDTLAANIGNDWLYGDAGDDILYGQDGADTIFGGSGADRLEGGAGTDSLTGGDGKDMFYLRTVDMGFTDTITDFTQGSDTIGVNDLDANSLTTANDTFTFLGTAEFTNVAGQLRYVQSNGNTYVYADVNGDGVADLTIELLGSYTLVKSDFQL